MPRSTLKRFVPISQDWNDDPEGWELTTEFGDRSIRIWVEVLRRMELGQNEWHVAPGFQYTIARKVRMSPQKVQRTIGWMLAKQWLIAGHALATVSPRIGHALASTPLECDHALASMSPIILRARNYAKYHKTHVPNEILEGNEHVPSFLPNPPNHPIRPEEGIEGIKPIDKLKPADAATQQRNRELLAKIGNREKSTEQKRAWFKANFANCTDEEIELMIERNHADEQARLNRAAEGKSE